jgi:ABC-type uncharacterized transport system substrate-binding protein
VPVKGLFFSQSTQIAQLALAARLQTVAADRPYVEAGLLASYGIDQRESYRRGASYVDRILKGAKAGDLPIEFPTRIELTINLKTAKALVGCGIVARSACAGVGDDAADRHLAANRSGARKTCRQVASGSSIERQAD